MFLITDESRSTLYSLPTTLIVDLAESISVFLAVAKYEALHLAVIAGDLGVKFGVSEDVELTVPAVFVQ